MEQRFLLQINSDELPLITYTTWLVGAQTAHKCEVQSDYSSVVSADGCIGKHTEAVAGLTEQFV